MRRDGGGEDDYCGGFGENGHVGDCGEDNHCSGAYLYGEDNQDGEDEILTT